jgi:hypothetical protein
VGSGPVAAPALPFRFVACFVADFVAGFVADFVVAVLAEFVEDFVARAPEVVTVAFATAPVDRFGAAFATLALPSERNLWWCAD